MERWIPLPVFPNILARNLSSALKFTDNLEPCDVMNTPTEDYATSIKGHPTLKWEHIHRDLTHFNSQTNFLGLTNFAFLSILIWKNLHKLETRESYRWIKISKLRIKWGNCVTQISKMLGSICHLQERIRSVIKEEFFLMDLCYIVKKRIVLLETSIGVAITDPWVD